MQTLESAVFRLAQIQIGKQPPQCDAAADNQGLLDLAEPAHKTA